MEQLYPAVVREGDAVIFDINGERQVLITVDSKSKVKLGKAFCSAAPLIGCPYGAMFALSADGKSLERTEYVPLSDWDLPDAPDFNTRTNAGLVDGGNTHQALSTADIEAMKAEGKAGADIVAALTAHSATFAAKTEFSQEKYKKKKAKKYIQLATVRRPTAAAVCEAYYASSPAKAGYLRADALALLLSFANVGAHARVLVVEGCGGLVTAAALERLGPQSAGCVVSAWAGGPGTRRPGLDMWRHFNFPPPQRAALRFAALHELRAEAVRGAGTPGTADGQQEEQQQQEAQQEQQQAQQQTQQPAAAADTHADMAEPMDAQQGAQECAQQPAADEQQQEQQQGAQQQGAQQGAQQPAATAPSAAQQPPFNSCILAANTISPLALVRHVLPLLAPSASLAVYCPWQAPLAEALDALRGQGELVGLALHEAWWREMQVLPLRTHPTMNMNHGGGFILSGTVLDPSARKQQQQQQQQ